MFFTSSYLHMLKRVEEGWDEDDFCHEDIDSKSTSPKEKPVKKSRKFFHILKGAREKLRRKSKSDSDESGNFSEASGYFGDDEVDYFHLPCSNTADYDIVNSVEVNHFQKRPHSLAWEHKRKKPKSHYGNTVNFNLEDYFIIETPDEYAFRCSSGACSESFIPNHFQRISSCDTITSFETPWSPNVPIWDVDSVGEISRQKKSTVVIHDENSEERACNDFCKECHQPTHSDSEKISSEKDSEMCSNFNDGPEWRNSVLLQLRDRNQNTREEFYDFESCFLENCTCNCHGKKSGHYLEEYNSVLKYVRSQLEMQSGVLESNLVFQSYDNKTLLMINQNRQENLSRVKNLFTEFSSQYDVVADDNGITTCRQHSTVAISWWRENLLEQLKVRNYWENKSFCDKEIAEHQRIQAHPELEEFDIISDSEDLFADTLSLAALSRSFSRKSLL